MPIDPQTLRFTETHEWVQLDGVIATVGISKFAVDQLTDLIMIDLPPVGKSLTAGRPFGEIESVKSVNDLYSPVSGEVIEVNQAVANNVQSLSDDPYDQGWLIKVRATDPGEISALMDRATYDRKVADSPH